MSRLNYHHLYYFWQVATQGNLTQVARALHVSQSALSAQIKQLEESMDTRLFDRQGRTLQLTEAGQRVLVYANDIFSKGAELESLLRHGIEPPQQIIRIGMLATMSRNFIEAFIAPLLPDPQVKITLQAMDITNLLDALASHGLDIVLSSLNITASTGKLWQSQLIARQPVSVMGPPGGKPDTLFPDGYQGLRWLVPGVRSEIRAAFDSFCSQWQFEPDIQAEVDDMAMLRLLARDSGALAVLPKVVVKDEIQRRELVEYMNLPNVFENFYAITIKRQFQPRLLSTLLGQRLVLADL